MSVGRLLRAFGSVRPSGASASASYTLANAAYASLSFGVADDGSRPKGVYVSPDGTKMYVAGDSRNGVTEYTLSTPHDVSTASRVQLLTTTSPTELTGVNFSDDGTKMYTSSRFDDLIGEYTLSTPWDISTATKDNSIGSSGFDGSVHCVHVRPNGDSIYLAGQVGASVIQLDMSTPYDLSTASQVGTLDVSGNQTDIFGIFISPDGTKLILTDETDATVTEYDLSTPWDITSGSFVRSFSVSTEDTAPGGVGFSDNGAVMYVLGQSADSVFQYDTPA